MDSHGHPKGVRIITDDKGTPVVIRGLGQEIPVLLSAAADKHAIDLPYLCITHSSRVEQVQQCISNGEVVEEENLRQGFFRNGSYIVIEEADLQTLLAERTQVLLITQTRSIARFEPEWVKKNYWAYSEAIESRALASFWAALDREQLVAMGALTLGQRVSPVAVRAVRHNGSRLISVMRLHWPTEIKAAKEATKAEPEANAVLAFRDALVEMDQSQRPMLEGFTDVYFESLQSLISEREEEDRVKTAQHSQR